MNHRAIIPTSLLLTVAACNATPTPETDVIASSASKFLAYDEPINLCLGYLTQYESEDYCSAEAPDDWIPFEFDGQTYYFQPLSADVLR